MRWTVLPAFALAALAGCYSPNYSSKPCNDNSGCPSNYFCDSTRPGAGAVGTCSSSSAAGDMSATDLNSGIQPPALKEYLVTGKVAFTLGSNLKDINNGSDAPPYSTMVGNFCLQETEVTVAAYTVCVQSSHCSPPIGGNGAGCNYGVAGKETHPVNCVQYSQAQDFCRWMNRRLPTESEWEYAANGATTNAGEKFPWDASGIGTFDPAKACFNNVNGTCTVGSKPLGRTYLGTPVSPQSAGFYDLAGNVWEWTSSEFCTYPSITCNSLGRVVRGGSAFDTDQRELRSTVRFGNADGPSSVNFDMGFRDYWQRNTGFRCAVDVVAATQTCPP